MGNKKRALTISFTFGGILILGILLLISILWFYGRLTGKGFMRGLLQAQESRAVYSTLERVDDLALLDCAVYRIRVVYPYDIPFLSENLPVSTGRHEFCVISARVTAGYDLSSLLSLSQETDLITIDKGVVKINLGKPVITSLKVADQVVRDKGFPDMAVTPEEWRIIVDAVIPLIEQMALDRGIMTEAEKYGRDFFIRLFEGAGYEKIQFLP